MLFPNHLFATIVGILTSSPFAAPIWIALLLVTLAASRRSLLNLVFRVCGIRDEQFQSTVRNRIDRPLQWLILALACTPFTLLIAQPAGAFAVISVHFLSLFLLFHISIQSMDLAVFTWYFARQQKNVSEVVRAFALWLLYGISALLLLDWVFGVSVLPLLATSTILTAILGLALQDTLKNAFAGLNMSMEKSFEPGDWVMFNFDKKDQQWIGQIVDVGWRTTKIKTLNNNYAIIPNSSFTNHELINFNRPTPLHACTIELPVNFQADPDSVIKVLVSSALAVDGLLQDPRPQAFPLQIKNDCVSFQLRFWMTNPERRDALTGEVLELSWKELHKMGALPGTTKTDPPPTVVKSAE